MKDYFKVARASARYARRSVSNGCARARAKQAARKERRMKYEKVRG